MLEFLWSFGESGVVTFALLFTVGSLLVGLWSSE